MKKVIKAFTLLEIMIVITLIGIIIIGATNINFNSLSDKQRVDGFFYKIKNNIETIKNNVLIGREVYHEGNTIVSNKWQIDFNNSGSGSIKTYYYDHFDNKKSYSDYNITPESFYKIKVSNNGNIIEDSKNVGLIINGRNLSLTGITTNNKVLEIETRYKDKVKIFTINTISGIIEENQ